MEAGGYDTREAQGLFSPKAPTAAPEGGAAAGGEVGPDTSPAAVWRGKVLASAAVARASRESARRWDALQAEAAEARAERAEAFLAARGPEEGPDPPRPVPPALPTDVWALIMDQRALSCRCAE